MSSNAKRLLLLAGFSLVTGCATSGISIEPEAMVLPQRWQTASDSAAVVPGWLDEMADPALSGLVAEALSNNHQLAAQRALVRQSEQGLIVAGADRYPALDLSLDASRSRQAVDRAAGGAQTSYGIGLDLGWELDLWGKLSDGERQARLTLGARQAELDATRLDLARDLASAWYELLATAQQLALFSRRLHNLEQNLEVIESGYRLGLGSALDVYLARNDVESERARVEEQTQLRDEATRNLQRLLGRYPDGRWTQLPALPMLETSVSAGVPAELLRRRPDLRSAWMDLMASDAALAIAHKQRFPSLQLRAGVADETGRLPDLLEGGLAWSLAAGLTQPLFSAGRLKATEAQARARVEELEKRYLDEVFTAFGEVENRLSRTEALQAQYGQYQQAERNALLAEELAFEQYRKGLVEYSTVLEAQRRSLDAQNAVIVTRRDLLQNRVALYRALGGALYADTRVAQGDEPESRLQAAVE
ncbi:RND transporter [Marinobacterium nitratireducens]|uniref:RND transporter n=1 Tax=Marinobacterium nitratireducens TaxID=518897 RepID=A0A918DQL1_9GAMM|nr:efflux transporter outer membrane subunit [Marinobacterium nitratireducens]GGO77506.1 RND transporter [Marinobacterium nitratireducens]